MSNSNLHGSRSTYVNHKCRCDSCTLAHRTYARRWSQKASSKISYRKRMYGLSSEDFLKLLKLQDNRCAICQIEFTRTPYVDHDHSCCSGQSSCGKCIRGLLCRTCNVGLGAFGDNLENLNRSIKYLRKSCE